MPGFGFPAGAHLYPLGGWNTYGQLRPHCTLMNAQTQASSKKQSFAAGARMTAIVCAALSFLSFTLSVGQIFFGRTPSISAFAIMLCMLPVAIVCTIIALILVGPRQRKLAWISLGVFLLQFIIGFAVQTILMR